MSLLNSALATDTMFKAPPLTGNLVRVAQLTAEVNVIPRHHCTPASEEHADVDVTACLRLLLVTALGCVHDQEAIRRFWRYMRFDFVSMLLHTKQRSEDVLLMLELLELGVLEDSLGPIAGGDEATQVTKERNILDGMSALLMLVVAATDRAGTATMERDKIVDIRLAVFHCLGVCCCSAHSGRAIAKHPTLIARLVKIINDELDALYRFHGEHSRW